MKKLLSILLSLTMMATIFSATVSAVDVGADLHPTLSFEVEKIVASSNKAWVNVFVTTDEILDYAASSVEDEESGEMVTTYSGKFMSEFEVNFYLNDEYFLVDNTATEANAKVSWAKAPTTTTSSTATQTVFDDGRLQYVFYGARHPSVGDVGKDTTKIQMFRALVPVKGSQTVEDITAANDWFTVDSVNYVIGEYAAGTTDANALSKQTTYSSNIGTADYDIVIEEDAPAEPEAPVVGASPVVDAENKAKTWTVNIAADYVAAGDTLTATLYDTTNTSDKQDVTLSMGNNVVTGGAEWSFTLKATFENAAKMADIALSVK